MKTQYKLAIASGVFFIPMVTAFAMMPNDKEQKFIELGKLEGQEVEIHKQADLKRAELEQLSTDWQTIENQRITLHDSLFR